MTKIVAKKCEWCDRDAEMWTYRLVDTGKKMRNAYGEIQPVMRPDHFIALCGFCASERINAERGVDWKQLNKKGVGKKSKK